MPFTSETKLAPYWWEAAPRPEEEPARVPEDADVAIVGSGYTGLSAALTLARAGRKVVVLDAEQPGWGASSRNGGMLGPAFHLAGAATLTQRFGEERAREIMREGHRMLDYLEEVVRREGIECHFGRMGRFTGATTPQKYESLARTLERNRKLVPIEAEMVPRSEQHREIGSDFFHGGLVQPRDGGLHPGLYHLGLLAAARRAGATVLGRTPVTGLSRERQRVAVTTPRGEISAGAAIVATNGYTGPVTREFRRRVIPIRSAIIATETFAPEVMARLMPTRRMQGDTRRIGNYFRPSPDGTRVLFGGRALRHEAEGPEVARVNAAFLHQRMTELFPELRDARVTHYWHGNVAFTFDMLPHLGEMDGIHYAMGYCGSGVTRSTWFGNKIALKVLGDKEGKSAFDGIEFEKRPLYSGKPWFLPPMIAWYRVLDMLGR